MSHKCITDTLVSFNLILLFNYLKCYTTLSHSVCVCVCVYRFPPKHSGHIRSSLLAHGACGIGLLRPSPQSVTGHEHNSEEVTTVGSAWRGNIVILPSDWRPAHAEATCLVLSVGLLRSMRQHTHWLVSVWIWSQPQDQCHCQASSKVSTYCTHTHTLVQRLSVRSGCWRKRPEVTGDEALRFFHRDSCWTFSAAGVSFVNYFLTFTNIIYDKPLSDTTEKCSPCAQETESSNPSAIPDRHDANQSVLVCVEDGRQRQSSSCTPMRGRLMVAYVRVASNAHAHDMEVLIKHIYACQQWPLIYNQRSVSQIRSIFINGYQFCNVGSTDAWIVFTPSCGRFQNCALLFDATAIPAQTRCVA